MNKQDFNKNILDRLLDSLYNSSSQIIATTPEGIVVDEEFIYYRTHLLLAIKVHKNKRFLNKKQYTKLMNIINKLLAYGR